MNETLYFASLVLMLPIAGFAAFGALIDSLTKFGLWAIIKVLFAPLYDPFGRGLWIFLPLVGFLGLCAAGFFPEARPYGLGAIALGGLLCTVYVVRTYPDPWALGSLFLFVPGLVGIGLSVYSLVHPIR